MARFSWPDHLPHLGPVSSLARDCCGVRSNPVVLPITLRSEFDAEPYRTEESCFVELPVCLSAELLLPPIPPHFVPPFSSVPRGPSLPAKSLLDDPAPLIDNHAPNPPLPMPVANTPSRPLTGTRIRSLATPIAICIFFPIRTLLPTREAAYHGTNAPSSPPQGLPATAQSALGRRLRRTT
jgi:hypothetical protein